MAGDLLSSPVLVLNRLYQPVRVTTARVAFTMLYCGRARALDADYEPHDFEAWRVLPAGADEGIRTPRGALRLPRVLLLSNYHRVPRAPMRLSRRNVFLRDDHTCQYCGTRRPPRELNLDHVLPRSRGGATSWENLVTSCRECNGDKGGATPEECGMRLLRPPRQPSFRLLTQLSVCAERRVEWEPFLS